MKFNLIGYLLLFVVMLCSCNYQKKLQEQIYFNDLLDSSHHTLTTYQATIKIDDRLLIHVSALNPESATPYNLSATGGAAGSSGGSATTGSTGYLVEKDGAILFPEIGKLKVEGKTLLEVRSELLEILSKYLTNPVITIQFTNAKILVMGEVGHSGALPIVDGKLTILEAITLSGDIPFTGRKDNVLVVREENGERSFARVNLQSHNIYKSPYYFLRQNDLIFVEPTLQKVKQQNNQIFITNIALITTVISTLSTSFFLLTYLKVIK